MAEDRDGKVKGEEVAVRSVEVLPPEQRVARQRPPGVSDILNSEVVPIPLVERYKANVIRARREVVEEATKYTQAEIEYLRTTARRQGVIEEIQTDAMHRKTEVLRTARELAEEEQRLERVSRKGQRQDLRDDVRELELERQKRELKPDPELEALRRENKRLKLERKNEKLRPQKVENSPPNGAKPAVSRKEQNERMRKKILEEVEDLDRLLEDRLIRASDEETRRYWQNIIGDKKREKLENLKKYL